MENITIKLKEYEKLLKYKEILQSNKKCINFANRKIFIKEKRKFYIDYTEDELINSEYKFKTHIQQLINYKYEI